MRTRPEWVSVLELPAVNEKDDSNEAPSNAEPPEMVKPMVVSKDFCFDFSQPLVVVQVFLTGGSDGLRWQAASRYWHVRCDCRGWLGGDFRSLGTIPRCHATAAPSMTCHDSR